MKYIGAHVSVSGGVENGPKNAKAIGANAFAMFTKNQRQWVAKPYTEENIQNFKANCLEMEYSPQQILPHDGYLINLAQPDDEKWEKSKAAFLDEIHRCEQLGLIYLNFHPGSHLKLITEEEGLDRIAEALSWAISKTENVILVIENTAGQGTNLGYTFEQLAHIIDKVQDKSRIAVCIDTCHLFTSGYDIRTKEVFDRTFAEFDKIVGFQYLKGMHLNDSRKELGSRLDRHHNLGKGEIGLDAFKFIMQDERFDNIPLVLETSDSELWAEEIKMLREMQKG